jgi:hypothetical protein
MKRPLLVVVIIAVVAIALGTLVFLFGPSSTSSGSATSVFSGQSGTTHDVPFTVLQQGTNAISVTERTNYRITNANDLATLWPLIYGDRDAPNIPNVNFSKYEVLAVFDGTHTTAGYSVQVTSIVDSLPTRTVTITHIAPEASCNESTQPNSPFQIVQVPITTYNITHIDVASTTPCT